MDSGKSISFIHWGVVAALLATAAFRAHAAPGTNQHRDMAQARRHWAYQPILPPRLDSFPIQGSAATPIDRLVLSQLEAKGLGFAPVADKRTLVRRLYYDLTGLPPTERAIEVFVEDRSPDAWTRLVDELLASPAYGERWGRHWLDVARFAETKDLVLLFGKDRLRPYAYTYRDYVIRSFNEDVPFNRFVLEQLAADQLAPAVEPWKLAALGFLTLGRLFDNNPYDQIDDQIDTVSRALLGLTVACARCHDHKYDAIPTEDYYSLYGVFANTERPYDLPLIEDPEKVPGGKELESKIADARRKLLEFLDSEYVRLTTIARERVGDYLARVSTTPQDLSESCTFILSLSPEDLRPGLVLRWRRYLDQRGRPEDPIFGPWSELMALPEDQLAAKGRALISESFVPADVARPASRAGTTAALRQANSRVFEALTRPSFIPTNRADIAKAYGELFAVVDVKCRQSETNSAAAPLDAAERELLSVMTDPEGPVYFPKSQTPHHLSRVEADKFGGMVRELDRIAANASNRPPARAMILRDSAVVTEPRVLVRGSPSRPGARVPRRFLEILGGSKRSAFSHGSGRLDLAAAIASDTNPLTARVIANRVWMFHFGIPLVNSPGDFGVRAEPPSNPGLLDYLASYLISNGWSLKKLHREILRTAVYQQSAQADPNTAARAAMIDPENRLFSHFPRRRLDLESMRDTLLAVSGRLDSTMGGRSEEIAGDAHNCRRTVYGLIDRQELPGMYRAFDFACPDQSADQRPRTTVPQQALFAMNSPFVLEQAAALARATDDLEGHTRVAALYRKALGRLPTSDESASVLEFVRATTEKASASPGEPSPWEQFSQVLLMSNELMFVE